MTGQRMPFYVELRARGSFAGTASFAMPEILRTFILKVGNPVVSSQEIDGESWFVQTHEFALFSQQSGSVEIPEFEVRFGSRDSFTGPVKEQQAQVPAAYVEILSPPGSESVGFLVTTESLDLTCLCGSCRFAAVLEDGKANFETFDVVIDAGTPVSNKYRVKSHYPFSGETGQSDRKADG